MQNLQHDRICCTESVPPLSYDDCVRGFANSRRGRTVADNSYKHDAANPEEDAFPHACQVMFELDRLFHRSHKCRVANLCAPIECGPLDVAGSGKP